MSDLVHQVVDVGDVRIHLVERGRGPLVLFVHGFPESWYSWRHQLPAVAEAGFRAVAIDVRGYGRSSAPWAIDSYGMLAHVSDNLGVLAALGEREAVLVGHDWGSPIAATSALLRPDAFPAVALLSVPYTPPGGPRPTEAFARIGGDEEFYINYFQEPGRAEAEIETNIRSWLLGMYIAASANAVAPADGRTIATVRPGGQMRDRFVIPQQLPDWLGEADLEFYVEEFERTGFRGALNRYRNVDRDWVDLRSFAGLPIRQPSLFIAGDLDGPARWGARSVRRHEETLPDLRGSHILEGCGHWVQQERPDEVNRILIDWLRAL